MGKKATRRTLQAKRPVAFLTTDMVILVRGDSFKTGIVLVRRGRPPFRGRWALPGGFVEEGEKSRAAARRELFEETGLRLPLSAFTYLACFSDPGRDPRGRVVTEVFIVQLARRKLRLQAGDDAREARVFDLARLPPLAFDHEKIVATAKKFLKN
ncbi:MAG: NUDIX hydrolase [Bdellovibrionota bacterium]